MGRNAIKPIRESPAGVCCPSHLFSQPAVTWATTWVAANTRASPKVTFQRLKTTHLSKPPNYSLLGKKQAKWITCLRNHHHYTQRTFLFSNLPQNIQYTVKSHKLPCDLKLLADILLVKGFLATKKTEAAPVQVTSVLCTYLLQRTDHPQESTGSNLRHAKYITLSR